MKQHVSLVLIALLISASCFAQNKETRNLDGFTKVSFGVAGKLILKQGNKFNVVLEGDKDFLDEIRTEVKGNSLVIRKSNWKLFQNKKVLVYITMPEVEGLSISGSGLLVAEGAIESDGLDLNVSGSGDIVLKELEADMIDCGISGSGTIELSGNGADDGDISISGSGKYLGESFELDKLDVSISGSGTCKCWVNSNIEARVSGSGDIYYKGNPNIDARTSGSGKIRKQ